LVLRALFFPPDRLATSSRSGLDEAANHLVWIKLSDEDRTSPYS